MPDDRQERRRSAEMIIIHVDMDAFYASVEIRDDPSLGGKPLIIGSLPEERGVVATCSYEARKYGVRSGMNIKEAYRLCPGGIYRHPNFEKYKAVSARLREIWKSYATAVETVALDEAYLDVTETAGSWDGACQIARTIKARIKEELKLSCSVGVAYSKTAAKTASEEKKPDGYFEIRTAQDFVDLIIDRDVQVLYTVGRKTAEKLHAAGFRTVRDIRENPEYVVRLLGRQGEWISRIARGIDERAVTAYRPEDAKSVSRELTFQQDVDDFSFRKEVLLLLSVSVERRARRFGLYGKGVTLKLTYADMKSITRSCMVSSTDSAAVIYRETARMLKQVEERPVRLVGAGLHNLESDEGRQLGMADVFETVSADRQELIRKELETLGEKYRIDFLGHLEELYHSDTLYRAVEYMRRHRPDRV